MNIYFLLAGILSFIIGLVHSILGEIMIFNAQRKKGGIVPSIGNENIRAGQIGIIWATWHLASVLGWVLGASMIFMAFVGKELTHPFGSWFIEISAYGMLIGSALVLLGTKGKHPGWIGLLLTAILLLIGLA